MSTQFSTLAAEFARPAPGFTDLGDVARALRRRALLIALCAAALAGLGLLVARQAAPLYVSQAQVMLETRERRLLSGQEVVSAIVPSDAAVASESAVIRSNLLLGRVADALDLDADPVFVEMATRPPLWRRGLTAALTGLGLAAPPEAPQRLERSRVIRAMQNRLVVRQVGISHVIGVEFAAADPALAARVANGVAEAYVAEQVEFRRRAAVSAAAWLEEQAVRLRANLDDAEAAVQRARAGILVAEGGGGEVAASQLARLSDAIAAARADRAESDARAARIGELIESGGPGAAADVVSSPIIAALTERRAAALTRLAGLSAGAGAASPDRRAAEAELAAIDAVLEQEIRRRLASLRHEADVAGARQEALERSVGEVEARLAALGESTAALRRLEREADVVRLAYEALLSRLTETRAQSALSAADVRQIAVAEPPEAPDWPRPTLFIASGAAAGLLIGAALALMLELLGGVCRSAAELTRESRLPLLASLPVAPGRRPARRIGEIMRDGRSAFAERMRHLRMALLLSSGDKAPRVILAASAVRGEGKTTTLLALAHTAAALGRRAIVVDGDLRDPALTRACGGRSGDDLLAALAGRCALDAAIQADPGRGFDLLPCARATPGEVDALASPRFAEIVAELRRRYDVVLIDSAPLMTFSDACLIGRHADACMFLVRWGRTRRRAALRALEMLDEMRIPVAGLVLTMVDRTDDPELYLRPYGAAESGRAR